MSEWTSIAQPMQYIVELDAPLTVRRERGVLVQGDQNANAFVMAIYQTKGTPADLTGCTVILHFVRPDNLAAPAIEATIEGNIATAVLTSTCYRVSGMYGALITLKKDGVERTILKTIGDMISTENSGTVDEEGIFPTAEELMQTLQVLEEGIQNANTAADNANAAASKADTSAGKADTAAASANSAASAANTAAANADKWANAEATAAELAAGSTPTVTVTEADGKKQLTFGIPIGATGPVGDTGPTPVITFQVATGEPGTSVQVEQSGTAENPIVKLTIPRGTPGDSGASLVVDDEGNGTIS